MHGTANREIGFNPVCQKTTNSKFTHQKCNCFRARARLQSDNASDIMLVAEVLDNLDMTEPTSDPAVVIADNGVMSESSSGSAPSMVPKDSMEQPTSDSALTTVAKPLMIEVMLVSAAQVVAL